MITIGEVPHWLWAIEPIKEYTDTLIKRKGKFCTTVLLKKFEYFQNILIYIYIYIYIKNKKNINLIYFKIKNIIKNLTYA